MAKKCIYCHAQIDEQSVVDVCRRCGIGVWGEKMFAAILQNMNDARDAGDLYQGSVTQTFDKPKESKPAREILTQDHDQAAHNIEREKALAAQHVDVEPVRQSEPFAPVEKKEEKSHEIEILSSSNEAKIVPNSEDVLGSLN